MKRTLSAIIAWAALCPLALSLGCATIFKGTGQEVTISSHPDKARLYLNGEYKGLTPAKLKLSTGRSPYTVEVRKEGYESSSSVLEHELGAGWVVADVFTYFVGLLVDGMTGAWNSLPESMNLEMAPLGGAASPSAPALACPVGCIPLSTAAAACPAIPGPAPAAPSPEPAPSPTASP